MNTEHSLGSGVSQPASEITYNTILPPNAPTLNDSDVDNSGVNSDVEMTKPEETLIWASSLGPSSVSAQADQQTATGVRRRGFKACSVCQLRKTRCGPERPCAHCLKYGHECVPAPPRRQRRKTASQLSKLRCEDCTPCANCLLKETIQGVRDGA